MGIASATELEIKYLDSFLLFALQVLVSWDSKPMDSNGWDTKK
jgi:hypothetical protein